MHYGNAWGDVNIVILKIVYKNISDALQKIYQNKLYRNVLIKLKKIIILIITKTILYTIIVFIV